MSISPDQLKQLRSDTPSCEEVLHFNNAGASLMPDPVYQTVVDHIQLERRFGGYRAARQAAPALANFYQALARLIGAKPDEIAYVENATRAWDMAFYALPLQPGDRILTHQSEYVSNYLAFMQLRKRLGVEVDLAVSDDSGQIDVDALEQAIRPRTRVIAVTHMPSQSGLINPVEQVGQVARRHGLWFLLDACQSVGHVDVDVNRIGCHCLAGTGRKFLRGPRGTGFLYVSSDIIDRLQPPFIDLHSARWTDLDHYEWVAGAKRFEVWESHVAGRLGLAAAVDYALSIGMTPIEERVIQLAATLRENLSAIPGVEVADPGVKRSGIVSFIKRGKGAESPEALVARLEQHNVHISASFGDYARLDLEPRKLPAVARASVHYFNTLAEIDRFCSLIE